MVLRWPSRQGGERGQNTWDLIFSQLPNLWAGFPRAAPTLNGFSSPISSCRPTQLLSQLPTPLTRAKTSNSCPEERFQRFFFFFPRRKLDKLKLHPSWVLSLFCGEGCGKGGRHGSCPFAGQQGCGWGTAAVVRRGAITPLYSPQCSQLLFKGRYTSFKGFPDSSVGKESACNAGDPGSIPESGRSSGEGLGYPLQDSWTSLVAQLVKNLPAVQETWLWSLGWEDPLEKEKCTNSSILV